MIRKKLRKQTNTWFILLFLCVKISLVYGQNQKPNIVLIITDDQSAMPLRSSDNQEQSRPFGFNGDTKVYTPIIDGLANNGIVFNNAFVSTAICTPSRYSILTGKYAGRSQGTNFTNSFPLGKLSRVSNNIELEENVTNLPRLLQTAGYKTAFIGKSHIIDHHILENYTEGTNGFMPYAKTANPYNASVSSAIKFNHDKWSNRMKEFGFDHVNAFYPGNLRELFNNDLNVHNVEYKNKAVLDFIEDSNEDPFFIYYSETIPHGPEPYRNDGSGYYAGLDSDVNITAEGVLLNQDYTYLPTRQQIKNEISGISGKDARHAWLRWFDHAVGAVVAKLQAKGKLDNTIIIITSDHGDFNKSKATNYEGGIKVPLMVYWPNGISNPRSYDELVQNIDFTPTFLDIAGVDTSNITLDGKSLKNVLTTNSNEVIHDHLFFEMGYSRAIRTKDWKYITVRYPDNVNTQIANGGTFPGPNGTQVSLPYYIPNVSLGSLAAAANPLYHQKDQLFNLANDPYETQNLFNTNPEKATELRNILRTELLDFPNRPYQEFTNTSVSLTVSNEATSILGKVMAGYQGWFNTPTDGSERNWNHYETNIGGVKKFEPGFTTVDFWPDMSEADADEKYATSFTHKDGSVANVFSSTNAKTVNRHFKWMNDYGIDGVFFQQFASNLKSNNPKGRSNDITVLDNIIAGAKANNNRLVSIMYDLSGANATGTMVNDIKQHWQEMAIKHGVNDNTKEYVLTYQQKPVVALWGVGFNRTDNYDLDDVQELITYFKNNPTYGGCKVLLGVPRSWRTLNNDAVNDAQLHTVIKSADIVHPWTVGRYTSLSEANSHKSIIAADKAWCDVENLLYMPVVFPGFSWQNLKKSQGTVSDLNSIPRLKGEFLWRQFYNAIDENVSTIYVAMFDEMDEGTCIFKVNDNPPSSTASQFTNYQGLPNDYYLWLTGKAGEALRGEISLTSAQPSYPNLTLPNTHYVTASGNDSNTGTSLGTAFKTLQKAHDYSTAGNKVFITGDIIHNSKVQISKSLDFVGLSNATLSPDNNRSGFNRMFDIATPNLTVSFKDLIFKGNTNTTVTGAVMSMTANSIVNITNVLFEENSSTLNGGVLYATAGTMNVLNTTFYKNSGNSGGGIFVAGSNTIANVTNSTFFQNKILNADKNFGAAIRVENQATVTLTNCLAWDNKANNGAGGESGFNSTPNGITNALNSLVGYASNTDTNTNSNLTVNLANSNLSFDHTLNKVIFSAPNTLSDDSPIDFGSDNSDVGAWDSKINIFRGASNTLWNNSSNWSNNTLPSTLDNVAILTGKDCTLDTNATIKNLKVTSNLRINAGKSLIVTGVSNGEVIYKRPLSEVTGKTDGWYLVSSPFNGQNFTNAYANTNELAVSGSNRGIAIYNTSLNNWTYLKSDDSNSNLFTSSPGKGYAMKIDTDDNSNKVVTFKGQVNTEDTGVNTAVIAEGNRFNLIGNPYSANINSGKFLEDNSANLSSETIWMWNKATKNHETRIRMNNFIIAPTQGFYVRAKNSAILNFAESNQLYNNNETFQKSAKTEIHLKMVNGSYDRFAKIYFLENATKGFDNGYDGETFSAVDNPTDIFTYLLKNNEGKKYQIQSLPFNEIENTIVPLGLKAEANAEIVFSSENVNLPSGVKVFLEDRENNSFIRLDETNSDYKVTLTQSLNGIGRFYLHTTRGALSTDDIALENISIYATNKTTLRIVGLSQGKSNLKLFNILGKQVLNTSFNSNGVFDVNLPKLTTGVYIVQLESKNGSLNKKIVLE